MRFGCRGHGEAFHSFEGDQSFEDVAWLWSEATYRLKESAGVECSIAGLGAGFCTCFFYVRAYVVVYLIGNTATPHWPPHEHQLERILGM